MYAFDGTLSVSKHVIVHEKHTLLDQRGGYNCWNVSASFWIYQPQNTDDRMVYAHQAHGFT